MAMPCDTLNVSGAPAAAPTSPITSTRPTNSTSSSVSATCSAATSLVAASAQPLAQGPWRFRVRFDTIRHRAHVEDLRCAAFKVKDQRLGQVLVPIFLLDLLRLQLPAPRLATSRSGRNHPSQRRCSGGAATSVRSRLRLLNAGRSSGRPGQRNRKRALQVSP